MAGTHAKPIMGLFLLARLEKLILHREPGRALRKVLSQLWRIVSPRRGTAQTITAKSERTVTQELHCTPE